MTMLGDLAIKGTDELNSNAIDMTGKRYGNWLVLRVAFRRFYGSRGCSTVYWRCRCLGCGREAKVAGGALRRAGRGGTTQCRECAHAVSAAKSRERSRPVGDGRRVAQIAQATGLKLDTVYHRLIRGWKPEELSQPVRRAARG